MVSSRYKTGVHMKSQRLWQHTPDLHQFKPDKMSARRRSAHKMLFAIDICWQRKKNSFLRCVGYNSSTLQGKPHAHEQLTNTEWTQWYFCGLCCFITLYCQFLNFYSALIFNFYFAYILTTVFPSSTSPCPFLHFLSLPWSTPPPFLFNKRQTS